MSSVKTAPAKNAPKATSQEERFPNLMKRTLPVDEKLAKTTATTLEPILIDLIELKGQAKRGHWNLRDVNFIALHRLMDEVVAIVDTAADEVAERIRQLGQPVAATTARVAKENRLPAFPEGELNGVKMIASICASMQKTIQGMREGIDASEDEPITADLLTQAAGKLELQLWFLDSHLG